MFEFAGIVVANAGIVNMPKPWNRRLHRIRRFETNDLF